LILFLSLYEFRRQKCGEYIKVPYRICDILIMAGKDRIATRDAVEALVDGLRWTVESSTRIQERPWGTSSYFKPLDYTFMA
jgi:hypothetical protein